jgi:hypothetical protein
MLSGVCPSFRPVTTPEPPRDKEVASANIATLGAFLSLLLLLEQEYKKHNEESAAINKKESGLFILS